MTLAGIARKHIYHQIKVLGNICRLEEKYWRRNSWWGYKSS